MFMSLISLFLEANQQTRTSFPHDIMGSSTTCAVEESAVCD